MVHVEIDREKITAFCERWKVSNLALFGSVLRDDFREDSDLDVLVEFRPDATVGLFDLSQMQRQLSEIFGREVVLVDRRSVEQSRNYFRRKSILCEVETIYAS